MAALDGVLRLLEWNIGVSKYVDLSRVIALMFHDSKWCEVRSLLLSLLIVDFVAIGE